MAIQQWATLADVVDRWVGPGAPNDEVLVDALILDASNVILAEFPLIQDRIDGSALSADTVKLVVCRMVTRVLRNPENLTYSQQATGPFSQGRNFGGDRDIWLTAEERAMLAPEGRGKAFSFNIAPDMVPPATELTDDVDPLWRSAS